MTKVAKWIKWVMIGLLIISYIIIGVVAGARKAKISRLKNDLSQKELLIDSLQKRCDRLSEMDAIKVGVTFQVKNVNVAGVQKVGDISLLAEQYASYTRKEVLDSILLKKNR